jgi:2-polyprenyl-3-methyl-5-hydroxy-6-metoxy-1,4-benzoquinol methylase
MSNNRPPDINILSGPARNTDGPPKPRILFEGCPLCKSSNMATLGTADCSRHSLYSPVIAPTITWMRCNDCSHVFTDGYFSSEVAAIIFEKTHDNQKPGSDFERQRYISARMVASVAQYVKGGSWLDVGFGNGSLLFTVEEWGFTPIGIDLRPSSVEAMRRLGIEASCVDIVALDGENRFSVISMADVLEHMPFPRDGLAAARRLLLPEGILFVSMPNYNCAAWRLLDAINANPFWGELEHFHNFSRSRLYTLMKDMGFEATHYGVSERYRVCMEVILRRVS